MLAQRNDDEDHNFEDEKTSAMGQHMVNKCPFDIEELSLPQRFFALILENCGVLGWIAVGGCPFKDNEEPSRKDRDECKSCAPKSLTRPCDDQSRSNLQKWHSDQWHRNV
jgi:hypothetical protein